MYDVVLLVEQELSEPDAKRVVALHQDMPEPVKYHVLVPCHNAEAGVEASISALGTADLYGAGLIDQRQELAEAQRAIDSEAKDCTSRSVQRLRDLDQQAEGGITHDRPIDALTATVNKVSGREVIILTRPHIVAEFFHLDWTNSARRHLGVPVLHLLEQEEQKKAKK
ncbi:hypothetical protein EV643_108135 [Kribbella sp. VKM Ac-2527]|uniref:Universal stress protein family protein n=1 Tax=Kribbella caucasensis TaxID=2512215 RepID=A0A4R6KE08_9ACTN|nr:hypothetical protein [Kribbella sp. VKM Ac-2527]TDO47821.1 hypothetical protein EV643_108135 [Kribbella sp. VKM Ac-2527]